MISKLLDRISLSLFYRGQRLYREQQYYSFRKKYTISPTFRFNGGGILMYGSGTIVAGEASYVGEYSTWQAYDNQTIQIGKGCSISHNVRAYTATNHADQDFSGSNLTLKTGDIIIGDYVWIGANVLINPGIKIGRNSIVGANSVVTKDVPPFAIVGGVPAKLIRIKKIS